MQNPSSSLHASMTTTDTGIPSRSWRSTCSMTLSRVFHSLPEAHSPKTHSGSSSPRPVRAV